MFRPRLWNGRKTRPICCRTIPITLSKFPHDCVCGTHISLGSQKMWNVSTRHAFVEYFPSELSFVDLLLTSKANVRAHVSSQSCLMFIRDFRFNLATTKFQVLDLCELSMIHDWWNRSSRFPKHETKRGSHSSYPSDYSKSRPLSHVICLRLLQSHALSISNLLTTEQWAPFVLVRSQRDSVTTFSPWKLMVQSFSKFGNNQLTNDSNGSCFSSWKVRDLKSHGSIGPPHFMSGLQYIT